MKGIEKQGKAKNSQELHLTFPKRDIPMPIPSQAVQQDGYALINSLDRLLRDQYRDGAAIIQEMIQNAEDAQAETMHFGWTGALPNVTLPLLQGPALFFINDGSFTDLDAENISLLGINYKAGDGASIGRFGLGLKSIFHLCEAFLYFSPPPITTSNGIPRSCIVNPWKNAGYHSEWNNLEDQDLHALQAHLRPLLANDNWFCLWIPLRKRSHCVSCDPIVEAVFPGDADSAPRDIFSDGLPGRLAALLPLLHRLRTITAWQNWKANTIDASPSFRINVAQNPERSRRRAIPEKANDWIQKDSPLEFGGLIETLFSASEPRQLTFVGQESWLSTLELFHEQRLDEWPKTFAHNPETGRPQRCPEKAFPHSAACFSINSLSPPGLVVRRAVFLPLADSEDPKQGTYLPRFVLTLHGYFFVDAGRRDIEGRNHQQTTANRGEGALRADWNEQLLRHGTLPLVLPALERLAEVSSLSCEDVKLLTGDLSKSWVFDRDHIQYSCCHHQWCFLFKPLGANWSLVPKGEAILDLPDPKDQPDLPHLVFRRLSNVVENYYVSVSDWPRLTEAAHASPWPEKALTDLLDLDTSAVFADHTRIGFLNSFLEMSLPKDLPPRINERLCALARDLFQRFSFEELRKRQPSITSFLTHLPETRRLSLPIGQKKSAEHLYKEIGSICIEIVLIPSEFAPERHTETTICTEEAVAILRIIAKSPEEDIRSKWAILILKAATDRSKVLEICSCIPLFSACDLSRPPGQQAFLANLSDFRDRKEHRSLFLDTKERRLPQSLQQAIPKARVTLIEENVANVVFGPGVISQCIEEPCLDVLELTPTLATPILRKDLLTLLLSSTSHSTEDRIFKCLRYLCHGDLRYFDDLSPLLAGEPDDEGPWQKIIAWTLRQEGLDWQIIPPELVEIVQTYPRHLRIEPFSKKTALRRLAAINHDSFRHFDEASLSSADRAAIIREANNADLLRRLPIHEDLDGHLHSIGSCTYWLGDFHATEPLPPNIVLLCPSDDPVLWATQKQLADPLDARILAKLLVQQENLQIYWRVLLHCLISLPKPTTQDAALQQSLREIAWLPGADDGVWLRPENVIHLKGLDELVHTILKRDTSGRVSAMALCKDLQDRHALTAITTWCLPNKECALSVLGEVLSREPENNIGPVCTDETQLNDFLVIFRDHCPAMPVASFVYRILQKTSVPECLKHLLPHLQKSLPEGRLLTILDILARPGQPWPAARNAIHRVYNAYLSAFVGSSGFENQLPNIHLLSRAGNWRKPSELCMGAEGVHNDDQIDQTQGDILSAKLGFLQSRFPEFDNQPASRQAEEMSAKTSLKSLQEFLEPWEALVPREIIGGFLSVLGDDENIGGLAERYLRPNFTIQLTRQRMNVQPYGDETVHNMMQKQRFIFEVWSEDTVPQFNLLGQVFRARIAAIGEHFFLDYSKTKPFPFVVRRGYRTNFVRIQYLNAEHFANDKQALRRLLQGSAERILREVFNQSPHFLRLDRVFESLNESPQRDIGIAQTLVLDPASCLAHLRLREDSDVGELMKQWDVARRRCAEEIQAKGENISLVGETSMEMQETIRLRLKKFLIDEEQRTVRARVLDAVCKRIRDDFQYRINSVPFELFQNADDAYVELDKLYGETTDTRSAWIAFSEKDEAISIMHSGRPINRHTHGDRTVPGFDRDLEKMLMWSSSDKGEDVIGKFGLGFKSVFLVTDTPRVISDRLAFEVLGGVYPQWLAKAADLHHILSECDWADHTGTLFYLPLRPTVSGKDVLARFSACLPLLLTFSQRIKKCKLTAPDGRVAEIRWIPRPVTPSGKAVVGDFSWLANQNTEPARGLHISLLCGKAGILFGIDCNGLSAFSSEVPSLWVSAPTQHQLDTGFAINGKFALDVGRARLAPDHQENQRLAAILGKELGRELIELFDASGGHDLKEEFRRFFGIASDSSGYEFWRSMWILLARRLRQRQERHRAVVSHEGREGNSSDAPLRSAFALVQRILWSNRESGAACLYFARSALPTELQSSGFQLLVPISAISAIVTGCIDAYQDLFQRIALLRNSELAKYAGRVVSESRTWQVLTSLFPEICKLPVSRIDLGRIISWELGPDLAAQPAAAQRLGSVINLGFFDQYLINASEERKQLEGQLKSVQFHDLDHDWRLVPDLLLRAYPGDDEERRLACFAPAKRVLHGAYSTQAIGFFLACRGRRNPIPIDDVVEWAIYAGLSAQAGVKEYLKQGDRKWELAAALRRRGTTGTWLEGLTSLSAGGSGEKSKDEEIMMGMLNPGSATNERSEKEEAIAEPADFLSKLASWWQRHGPEETMKYEQRIYGSRGRPALSTQGLGRDLSTRQAWLLLFLRGMMHTLGWHRAAQHAGFLDLCEARGWLRLLASHDYSSPAWLERIEDYVEKQQDTIEYYHWLRQFIGVSTIARHLDDYCQAFLAIGQIDRSFAIDSIVRPRASNIFGFGTGVDAPPLDQILGTGVFFVVRELVRAGVLVSKHAHEHCYVPTVDICALLRRLKCDIAEDDERLDRSSIIYRFLAGKLADPTFGGSFDLPLMVVSSSDHLIKRLQE